MTFGMLRGRAGRAQRGFPQSHLVRALASGLWRGSPRRRCFSPSVDRLEERETPSCRRGTVSGGLAKTKEESP